MKHMKYFPMAILSSIAAENCPYTLRNSSVEFLKTSASENYHHLFSFKTDKDLEVNVFNLDQQVCAYKTRKARTGQFYYTLKDNYINDYLFEDRKTYGFKRISDQDEDAIIKKGLRSLIQKKEWYKNCQAGKTYDAIINQITVGERFESYKSSLAIFYDLIDENKCYPTEHAENNASAKIRLP